MCDVALGKMKRLYEATNVEKLEKPFSCGAFSSVYGVGKRGPDHSKSLIHPEGVQIPISPVIEYEPDAYQQEQR